MKKKLILAVMLGSLLSLPATVLANPFELVPAKHWSYDAIDNLAQAGLFADYGDVKFDREKRYTRYELAVLVGKAMASNDKATTEQKAVIDKLALEFRTELTSLGVNSPAAPAVQAENAAAPAADDKIKFSGLYRLRYQNFKDKTVKDNSSHTLNSKIELDATAKIADNWTGNFSWEAYRNFYNDAGKANGTFASAWGADGYKGSNDVTIANVTGPLLGMTMTVGKFNHTFGSGLIFDDSVSGVRLEFGKAVQTKVVYAQADSNVRGNTPANSYISKLSRVLSTEFAYDLSNATRVTAALQHWKAKRGKVDSMDVYDFNITTALNKDVSFYGTYDKTSADDNNRAYVLGIAYKNVDINKPGSYSAFLDYENFQQNTAMDTTYWMNPGSKGWAIGFNYVPMKNVKWTNVFMYDKTLKDNNLGPDGKAEEEGATQKFFRSQVFFYF